MPLPMTLDPAHPPMHVEGAVYRFPTARRSVDLPVAPAVVLTLAPDAEPPPGAVWLGGPSWRLPAADPVATALALSGTPGITEAFPDVILPLERRSFDDESYGGQWYLEALGMEALYAVSMGSARVAVLDSAIDIDHVDLIDAVDDPYDAFDDDDDPSPNPGEYCTDGTQDICDGHGTSVSGVIGARANNGVGIVGMCPECRIVPVKLLGEGPGAGSLSSSLRAFEHAIASDVAVINNSWGYTESIPVPNQLAEVIRRAATEPRGGKGALVVFAAGNDDREIEDDEMEAMPEVLCISATDSYGYPTNYTNYGATVDVAAPSATVTLAPEDGVTTTFGGTSAAAPVVSGLAAWAASVDPELTAQDLHDLLVDTAIPSPLVPADADGHNEMYGYGELSAAGVLAALRSPPDEEELPQACGCSTGARPLPLLAFLGLLFVRRRSC